MKTTLTPLKTFDLNINGVVFKNMKKTGELDGITELSNGTTKVTLLRTGSNFGGFFDSLFSDGAQSDWVPLRGTPDIQKAAALSQQNNEVTKLQINDMVSRFLGWKLPTDFAPDAGITFKPDANPESPIERQYKHEPTGTNLFTADQAKAMLLYVVDNHPMVEKS